MDDQSWNVTPIQCGIEIPPERRHTLRVAIFGRPVDPDRLRCPLRPEDRP